MKKLYYLSSRGTKIDLFNWPVMAQDYENLLKYEWEHKTTELDTSGVVIHSSRQKMKEVPVTVSIFCDSEDEFLRIQRNMVSEFDFDIINRTPGKLYWDNMYLNCYISGGEYDGFEDEFDATDVTLKISAANPFWIEDCSYYFAAISTGSGTGLNYSHNYPHNYSAETSGTRNINIDSAGKSNFELVVYGPCQNPVINIGDHTYSVNCSVLEGEYLRVDTRKKSIKDMPIVKVGVSGDITNVFNLRNKAESVLQKIPAGSSLVTWSGAFKFDLTVFAERSLPL